jgi:phosphoribosylformimino-5-aminoimidazole carboxamide ribotide isomerase
MRIIPVLDVKGGLVVRGVGGRRDEYRPVVSRLTDSACPLDVARAFRDHFGLAELYVADLDALGGARPALSMYAALRADGFRLWVDAGIREPADAALLAAAGVEGIIAGLESITGPAVLEQLCRQFTPERILFSLDLKGGQPLGATDRWALSPWEIARQAIAAGIRRLIVLDLAQVGLGHGTGTEELCRRLVATFPDVEVTAGGGVRGPDDLRGLHACGVKAVLVASALHDGRLRREDVQDIR